jgi:hypothetical protein
MLVDHEVAPTHGCDETRTAVPISFLYNANDDPNQKFRAEIEMISEKNLRFHLITLQQCYDEKKKPRVYEYVRRGAEDAWFLIKSIFPFIKDPEEIKTYNLNDRIKNENVKDQLGKIHYLQDTDAVTFVENLRSMITINQEADTFQLGGHGYQGASLCAK